MRHRTALISLCAALIGAVAFSTAGLTHASPEAGSVTEILDIDGNGAVDASTDGLLITRYAFGLRGDSLTQGAIGPNATRTPSQIESYLGGIDLDIDGNGTVDALTDALLVFRYASGLRGQPLIHGAIAPNATRTSATDTETWLAGLAATLPGSCSIVQSPQSSANAPVPPGTPVQLTANCSTGPGPIGYAWNNGATGAVQTVSLASTTTYTVTPANAKGTSATFSTTVNVTVAPGACSINQTPNTNNGPVTAGTSVTLSVSCATGSPPTSCGWSNGLPSNCTVNVSAPQSTTQYSVLAQNAAGSAPVANTTINVINLAPSGCGVTQTPDTTASPAVPGSSVNLSVTCSGGSTLTQCSWSDGLGSNCSVNVTAPVTSRTYAVIPSNSAGSPGTLTTTINVTQGQDFCTPADDIYPVTWPSSQQLFKANGFGNQRIAFRFEIPTTANINKIGFMKVVEEPGSAVVVRDYTVSKSACDFQSGTYIFNGMGASDTTIFRGFTINNPQGYKQLGASFNLMPGDVVYLNIRNQANGFQTCPYYACDIRLDLMY